MKLKTELAGPSLGLSLSVPVRWDDARRVSVQEISLKNRHVTLLWSKKDLDFYRVGSRPKDGRIYFGK